MVREFLAQIEPPLVTASRYDKLARRGKWSWLIVGLAVFAVLFVIEHILDLSRVSSFVSYAVICLFVAWLAYKALAGEIGDETMRWQTSSIFIVVTVGVGYGLYLSRQGQEPAIDPASVMFAVFLGSCAASAYAQTVARERGEKLLDTALHRLRTPAVDAFEASLLFQSAGGVVWAIDPARRALRAIASGAPDSDRSIVWDEPIRAVELRRRAWWSSSAFDYDLLIRSGKNSDTEWSYVFEFPGAYRETAVRRDKIFEDWMIEDQRRMAPDR
jgi:hypothetical protein